MQKRSSPSEAAIAEIYAPDAVLYEPGTSVDSDHTADHVYGELLAYSPLVQRGDYLIVEDTNVNGHPAWPDFGPGPMEALERFLPGHPEFAVDEGCERFLMTLCPRGYLKRVAA